MSSNIRQISGGRPVTLGEVRERQWGVVNIEINDKPVRVDLAKDLRLAEASHDDEMTVLALNAICEELDIPLDETEQGLTPEASQQIDYYLDRCDELGKKVVERECLFAFRVEAEAWVTEQLALGHGWHTTGDDPNYDGIAQIATAYYGETDSPSNCWIARVERRMD